MELSPNDIRNYEFPSQLRGFDKDEVENFKEQVAGTLETLKQENLKLSMEIDSLKSQLQGLRQFEETIKNAAIDARRNADMTIATAKQEADLVVRKAKGEAEKLAASHQQQIGNIEAQISKMKMARTSYLTKLRQLIHNHLELVNEIASEEMPQRQSEESLEITDTAEVTSRKRETIATQPSKQEAIRTEEANAAESIIATAVPEPKQPEPTPEQPEAEQAEQPQAETETEQLKAALRDEAEPAAGKSIDPELAAALQSYQKGMQSDQVDDQTVMETPAPDEVVETTKRAEDIPDGFVADNQEIAGGDNGDDITTDKVQLAPEAQEQPTEHNTIDVDPPQAPVETKPSESVGPDNIADELDKVVAKFEEEMDKAEKN